MLREIASVQQKTGEPRRRWFFCHDIDLVVWLDDDDQPTAFQLAYSKYRNEHSISWRADRGFRHFVVDEGNALAGRAQTPLLWANGAFVPGPVIERFTALATEVPPAITTFVVDRLHAYPQLAATDA